MLDVYILSLILLTNSNENDKILLSHNYIFSIYRETISFGKECFSLLLMPIDRTSNCVTTMRDSLFTVRLLRGALFLWKGRN